MPPPASAQLLPAGDAFLAWGFYHFHHYVPQRSSTGSWAFASYWGIEMQVSQTVQDFNPGFPGFSLTKHDKKCHKNKLFIQFGATKLLQFAKYTLFFPFDSRRLNYLSSSIYNVSISKMRTEEVRRINWDILFCLWDNNILRYWTCQEQKSSLENSHTSHQTPQEPRNTFSASGQGTMQWKCLTQQ